MRRLTAPFIILLTCLTISVLSKNLIPPSCAVQNSEVGLQSKPSPFKVVGLGGKWSPTYFPNSNEALIANQTEKPKLAKIKPFEIFNPKTNKIPYITKLPPLPKILKKGKPKIKPKSQTPPQDEISLKPVAAQNEKIESPLITGTSADDTNYKKISLPEAIDYAMSHNFGIQSTRLENDKSRNDIKTAGRLLNPRIESFANFGQAAMDNPDYAGLIFPVELFKRAPRKRLAKSNLELVKGSVLLAELNLRLDTRQAYINLVAAKSTLKVLDGQRQLLQELLNIAQRKFEVGTVPQMDVIQAKMTLNQLLVQVNSARTDVLVARYKFNLVLLSKDFDTKEDYLPEEKEFVDLLTPKSTDKLPSFNDILELALSKRYDIKNAKQDIDVANKNLTVTIRKRIPDLELGAGGLYVPATLTTKGSATTGGLLLFNITNIPLLYQYKPEIKNARIQIEQKELIYKNTLHVATMDLHSTYDSFVTAQMNLNYYNDVILSESDRFLNMAKKSYIVGKTTMTELLYIEQSYKSIIMGYTTALTDYYNAWVDVLREVNDEEFKLNG